VPTLLTWPGIPAAGQVTRLIAESPGRGLTFAWDLDHDGAFDDGTGPQVDHVFGTGEGFVAVRATDEDGRVGETVRSVYATAGVGAPVATLVFSLPHPAVGQEVKVVGAASSHEAGITRIELDADGDGTYEVDQPLAGAPNPYAQADVTFATAGRRTLRARVTDARGGVAVATATLDVGVAAPATPGMFNLVSSPRLGTPMIFGVGLSEDVAATYAFDMDGDGDFTDDHPTPYQGPRVYTWDFAQPGLHTIAVRITGPNGQTSETTTQVFVSAGNLPPRDLSFDVDGSQALIGHSFDTDTDAPRTYSWDVDGDGTFGDQRPALHPGQTYRVAMRATDAEGASAFLARTWTVATEAPLAEFTIAGTTLTSTSTDPDGGGVVSAWDLDGDGAFDDATGPTAVATMTTNRVGLKVRDAGGDSGIRYVALDVVAALAQNPQGPEAPKSFTFKPTIRTPKLASLLSRGLTFNTGCPAGCKVTATIGVDKRTAKRLGLRSTVLGSGKGTTRVTVKLTPKARKALRRARSVRLKVALVATAADGRISTLTKSLTVKR
jgi:hypothetical protein